MKRGRLPLTALRSFEAAGRHLSFSRAAEELFVSQAAISRQVRELEVFLRQPLFERHHRRVELTDTGQRLLGQLVTSFDAIDGLLSDLVATPAQAVACVSVDPSLATSWLVPRLNRFRQLRPDIDISLDVDTRLIDFRSDQAELALRFSAHATSWPRSEAELMAPVIDSPVLSPALFKSGPALESPTDLRRHTLLHEENRQDLSLIHIYVEPNSVVRLNAGIYHVVSTYGAVNAVIRSDIRVEAGKLTEATVEHHAAEITMKLVREAGGEAIADTSWSLLNESGDPIKETVGAFASMVLAEGDYTIIAKNRDRIYQKDFTVVAGQNQEIEVLANEAAAMDPEEGAD